jgi:formylglycine-generating enzyme required for sulfatase activity
VSSFAMSQTLITQAQYIAVMGINPSYYDSGSTWPVDQVNWYDAALFCNKLSKLAGLDTVYTYASIYHGSGYDTLTSVSINYSNHGYRLPTEAEYEYANRAGTTTDYYWGQNYPPITKADTAQISAHAWWSYNDTPDIGTKPVATKPANAFGLYDMSGNVDEWCNDWYGSYLSSAQTDPTGPSTGTNRLLRGGSHAYSSYQLCAAYRANCWPSGGYIFNGFRCVRR